MSKAVVHLPAEIHDSLQRHLLADKDGPEEAAFVFARVSEDHQTADRTFQFVDWFPVPPEGFTFHSDYHIELSDETRAGVIKRAHDLGASIVEFHAHRGPWPAGFSGSDWAGLEEFVPHVWWRLKGRPYGAIVVTATGFDGLVWLDSPTTPTRLDALVVGGRQLQPTGLSPLSRDGYKIDY